MGNPIGAEGTISMRRRAFSLCFPSACPSVIVARHPSFINTLHANEMHHSLPLLRTSSSSAFIRYSGASQRCLCTTSMSRESVLTDTKKAAFELGKGAELVAFYSDHHVVNLPQGHRFPMDKYRATRGTIAAMHSVMLGLRRAAANIAGGTHHAFPDHGEGFCVFNDIAVAARVALKVYSESCNIERPILVIDLDVHQGNGTAKIFEEENRVVTFSIHGANNYPWRTKMKSDYDVDLPDDTDDKVYLAVLSDWLQRLFSSHNPSLIFFQAGVDALREDSFGRLSMTRQGLLQRNNMVYTACLTRAIPLVITMGGGYSRPSEASVLAHADVYRAAALRYGAI